MRKKSPVKKQLDDVRLLFAEAKIRNEMSDAELAKYLGIADRTLRERRADPSSLTLEKLFIILELAGRRIQFVEKE